MHTPLCMHINYFLIKKKSKNVGRETEKTWKRDMNRAVAGTCKNQFIEAKPKSKLNRFMIH